MKHYSISGVIIFLIVLLFTSCKQSPLCFRTGADYFPLQINNSAIYSTMPSNNKIKVAVIDTNTIYGKQSFIVERNGKKEYWCKGKEKIEKLYFYTMNILGREDTIAICWIPWLELPLSLHNSWTYSFNTSKIVLGDTIKMTLNTTVNITGITGNEYQIEINFLEEKFSTMFGVDTTNTTYYEWYKPNLGLFKKRYNDTTTETLIEFVTENDTLLSTENK
ncbi:MAG: hypothetical protein PHE49_05970 [bacterium]|nr:hypothetical protein [bacterium]